MVPDRGVDNANTQCFLFWEGRGRGATWNIDAGAKLRMNVRTGAEKKMKGAREKLWENYNSWNISECER